MTGYETCSWRRRCPAAFTLIELLVVIAILSLLVSILVPSLQRAKELARCAVCRTNLRGISMASLGYTTDTEFMPTGYDGWYIVWVPEIYPYASNDPALFCCPTAEPKARWAGPKFGSGLPAQYGYQADQVRLVHGEFFSYGHNNDGSQAGSAPVLGVGECVGWGPYGGWVPFDRVAMPSEFIMYGDSSVNGIYDHFIDEDYPGEYPADRHDGGAHLAFGDGHVEHDLLKRLCIVGNEGTILPELRRRWNNDHQPH